MLVNVEGATLEVQIQPRPNLKEKVRISQGVEASSTQRDANMQRPRPGEHLGDGPELWIAAAQGVSGPGAAEEAQMEPRALDTQSPKGLESGGNGKQPEMSESPGETALAEPFEDKQLFEMRLTRETHSSPKQNALLDTRIPVAQLRRLSSPLLSLLKGSPVLSKQS